MKKFLPKILFFYSVIAALFITASSVLTSQTLGPVIFTSLFLPVTGYFIIEFFKEIRSKSEVSSGPRKGEIVFISFIFLVLLGVGLNNIYSKSKNINQTTEVMPSSAPIVFKKEVTPAPSPIPTLTISITDDSPTVNIRTKPTIYSDIVSTAKDGDKFSYNKKDGEWYEVVLENGAIGYISFKYVAQ